MMTDYFEWGIFFRWVFASIVSVSESINPISPTKIVVMTKPKMAMTAISSFVTAKIALKISMATISRMPTPANVIGMNPATLAMG